MNSAIHGVRRIAHEFNKEMKVIGRMINIGKSRIHEIVASAKIYKQNNIIKNKPKRLKRPEEPLQNFSMDFTQKRIKSRFGQMEALNSKMQLYEIIAGKTT